MASVNKSKLIASAQKHLSKGNFDRALKDYQRILKFDPNDTSVRLKVGDLWNRLGDKAQAMAEYRRVASTFTSQGFYSKAIAVLKRIQTAEPDLVEIHLELAELNEKMGLLSEVVHHYQLAANVLDRKGEKREAIDVLKKVSEVGPPNLERRVKVAELYYKEGFPKAAYAQLVDATSDLDEHSPELLEVVKRMRKASTEDPKLIVRLGKLYLAHGDHKLAIRTLEEARAIEEEPLTLELLGEAKLHLELLGDAEVLFEKAAQLYEEAGERGKSRDLAARINEISEVILERPEAFPRENAREEPDHVESPPGEEMPREVAEEAGGDTAEKSAEELREESQEEAPETAVEEGAEEESEPLEEPATEPAKELIKGEQETYEIEIAGSEKSGDAPPPEEADDLSEDERLEVAFSEAEVYRKYGKTEGAARILEKVAVRFPDRHEPRIRLKEIYESTEEWAKVADQCRRLALIATLRGDEFRASRFVNEAKGALALIAGMPVDLEPREPQAPGGSGEPEIAPQLEEAGDEITEAVAEEEEAPTHDIMIDNGIPEGAAPPGEPPEAPVHEAPEETIDPAAEFEEILIRPDAFQEGHEEPKTGTEEESPAHTADGALDDLEILIDDEGANPGGAPLAVEIGEAAGDEIEPQLVIDGPGVLPSDEAMSDSEVAEDAGVEDDGESGSADPLAVEVETVTQAAAKEALEKKTAEEREAEESAAEEEGIEAAAAEEAEETTEEVEAAEETTEEDEVAAEEMLEEDARAPREAELDAAEEELSPEREAVSEAEEAPVPETDVPLPDDLEPDPAVEYAASMGARERDAAPVETAPADLGEPRFEGGESSPEEPVASEPDSPAEDDLEPDLAASLAGENDPVELVETVPPEQAPVEDQSEPEDDEEIYILDEPEDEEEMLPSWDWGPDDGHFDTSDGEETNGEPIARARSESESSTGPGVSSDESGQSVFDLRAELEGDEEAEDGVGGISDATDELFDLVSELRSQEGRASDSFDSQTRYDLGIAYKEMGLLDDAIRELILAGKDPERRIECCAVLGVCYRLQGRPEEAVRMLEECLGDSAITPEHAPGLLYELAIAHEEMGDPGKALDWYERVERIDPEFGDVGIRISALKSDRKKKRQ